MQHLNTCTENRTENTILHTQRTHNMHTILTHIRTHIRTYIRTKHTAHNHTTANNIMHRKKTIQQYAAHRTEYTEQITHTSTHNLNTGALHTICTHIVLIFMMNTYISKNSIIQLYTNYIQTIYILVTS